MENQFYGMRLAEGVVEFSDTWDGEEGHISYFFGLARPNDFQS